MLFAGLISSFHFLRIIQDNYFRKCKEFSLTSKIIFGTILSFLFCFSLYVVERLIFWGRILHITMGMDPIKYNYICSFKQFKEKAMQETAITMEKWLAPFILRGTFLKGKLSWLRLIILDLSLSAILTAILFWAISIISITRNNYTRSKALYLIMFLIVSTICLYFIYFI